MLQLTTGVRAEEVRQAAKHVLFVEGSGEHALDVTVLSNLFADTSLTIKALGASFSVKSAAQALHPHHPSYYFLIDRDHTPNAIVDKYWADFPDPAKHNLLMWRKRELESYFLDANYITESKFCVKSVDQVQECLIESASQRIFMDAANAVVVEIRDQLKARWIETFISPTQLSSADTARKALVDRSEFSKKAKDVAECMSIQALEECFDKKLSHFLGDESSPLCGHGTWEALMSAKPLFNSIVNKCFKVQDASGNQIQGDKASHQIAKQLLKPSLTSLPSDFRQLHEIISKRMI